MPDNHSAQTDELHQTIASLEAQLAELRQRLKEAGGMSLSGSGAQAKTGGVAGGAGSVVAGGDIQGGVFVGSVINALGPLYTGSHTPHNPAEALVIYRNVLFERYRRLSLRGLDVNASDPTSSQHRFDLTQVYIDLNTTTQAPPGEEEKKSPEKSASSAENAHRPLSVLEAVIRYRCLVLLGDPGSGKSTFLTHMTLCLAAHSVDPQGDWLVRLHDWPQEEADILPVIILLRDFARWLTGKETQAEPNHLWNFIVACLEAQNLTFAAEPLQDRFDHGQVFLLLDGLDEIRTLQQRTFIRDAVVAFATRYNHCRIIVTCRTLSYQEPTLQLDDFQSVALAPFDEKQINQFITAWYSELARLGTVKPENVEELTEHLRTAVQRSDLSQLAPNPLLLTVMALVHTHKGGLPDARALLYEDTIDILLWRWEQIKASNEDDAPRLRQLLAQAGRTDVDLKRVLWRLAFDAHREGGSTDQESVADIPVSQLHAILRTLHPEESYDWAHQVVEAIKLRAGLLVERLPQVYTFPHRTFQEYLAGAHLSIQPNFAELASQLAAEGTFWREVIALAVGRLVYLGGETAKPLALLAELCPAQLVDTEGAWHRVWMAGDVLLEMGLNRAKESSLGGELTERIRHRHVQLIRTDQLHSVERVRAGDTLSRLGDPRFRPDAWYLPAEPLLGFVEIPGGLFRTRYELTLNGWPTLLARREPQTVASPSWGTTATLPRYYIARYPVTVAQFQAFIQENSQQRKDFSTNLNGLASHPVRGLKLEQADAYCGWLTERLQEWAHTPEPLATLLRKEGWRVTLPPEAEWEMAARGTDGRMYPWGNEPDPTRANCRDTGIRTTSTVGCFPHGTSPFGIEELSGNVREWTQGVPQQSSWVSRILNSLLGGNDVTRGGSFLDSMADIRCTARFSPYFLIFLGMFIGFRVAILPQSRANAGSSAPELLSPPEPLGSG